MEIIDEYGGRHRLDLRVLATDDTWGAPSLLAAKVHGGQGIAVFSQVLLRVTWEKRRGIGHGEGIRTTGK